MEVIKLSSISFLHITFVGFFHFPLTLHFLVQLGSKQNVYQKVTFPPYLEFKYPSNQKKRRKETSLLHSTPESRSLHLCNSFAESGTVQSKVENWGSTEIF